MTPLAQISSKQNTVGLSPLHFTYMTLDCALAAVLQCPYPFQSPRYLCMTAALTEHYTVYLCLELFIACHLQPGKLTGHFETLESRRIILHDSLRRVQTQSSERGDGRRVAECEGGRGQHLPKGVYTFLPLNFHSVALRQKYP